VHGLWVWLWVGLWGGYPEGGAPVAPAGAHGPVTLSSTKGDDASAKAGTGKLRVPDLPPRRRPGRAVEN